MLKTTFVLLTLCCSLLSVALAEEPASAKANVIPKGAKVYVAPMLDGFDTFLKAAIQKKKLPIEIVSDKSAAQFEITGASETQKASAAKKVLFLDWRSNEQASIKVANLASGEIVFAYSVNKISSTHGKQSTAEACAKHLKEKIAN
jgi:hypothetical protein